MAALALCCANLWAWFARFSVDVDDIGLFNPAYTYATTGRMAYPAYGHPDFMVVHPPTHYFVMALLLKAGVPITYAPSIPPFALMVLTIWLIVASEFKTEIKLSFLFGFLFGLAALWWGFTRLSLPITPGMHLAFAWFGGLIALETGRLRDWEPFRLCLGAFLLTYASGLHYPASFAWVGVALYVLWVLRERGWRDARVAVAALVLGGCLFGIPYLAFFVVPHRYAIYSFLKEVNATAGPLDSIGHHLRLYRDLGPTFPSPNGWKAVLWPLRAGVPAVVITSAVFLSVKQTRAMALAGLPLLAPLLLAAQRKWVGYLYPELMLYFCALGLIGTMFCTAVFRRFGRRWALGVPAALFLSAACAVLSIAADRSRIRFEPRIDELSVARAAGRQLLGPNALVGSRIARSFTSGGSIYYRVEPDVLERTRSARQLRKYFAQFDAIAEDPFSSDLTDNDTHSSLSSWYADRTLSLRGFYLSPLSPYLSYMLLTVQPPERLEGYAVLPDDRVVRFRASESGPAMFAALVCSGNQRPPRAGETFGWAGFLLPAGGGQGQQPWLEILVAPEDEFRRMSAGIPVGCRVREQARMDAEFLSVRNLLLTLRSDPPLLYAESASEAVEMRDLELLVTTDSTHWPSHFSVVRKKKDVEVWAISRRGLRSDFDGTAGLQWERYGRGGRLDIVPDCFGQSDSCGRFEAGSPIDSVETAPFFDVEGSDMVFFAVWAKPLDGLVPAVRLQDETFSSIGTGRPRAWRADGWVLVAGATRAHGKVRVVVRNRGHAALLDKMMVAEGRLIEPRTSTSGPPARTP